MFWRWLFRSRGSRKVLQRLGSPYRASAELLPGAPPRPPEPPPRDRMRPSAYRPGAPRAPMLAVFGLISVAARLASVHTEGPSSYHAFPPPEFPSPRVDAWRDVAGPHTVAKAYPAPVGDVRMSIQSDREAKPVPLWNAFRAKTPLPDRAEKEPAASVVAPSQLDPTR